MVGNTGLIYQYGWKYRTDSAFEALELFASRQCYYSINDIANHAVDVGQRFVWIHQYNVTFVSSLARSVVITKPFVFRHASSVCNDLCNSLPITDVSLSSLTQLFSSRMYLAVICHSALTRDCNVASIRSVRRLLARCSITIIAKELHY